MLQLLKSSLARLNPIEAHVAAMVPQLECNPPSQDNIPSVFRQERFKTLDLHEITVNELQHLFSEGRLTSVDYVRFCLKRVQKVRLPQRQRHCDWCLDNVKILRATD